MNDPLTCFRTCKIDSVKNMVKFTDPNSCKFPGCSGDFKFKRAHGN